MNFFDFLKQSESEPTLNTKQLKFNKQDTFNIDEPKNTFNTESVSGQNTVNNIESVEDLKNGDYVRIKRYGNSILNSYIGYIGEIRKISNNTEYVNVILHAMYYPKKIKFHIKQIYKI